MSLTEKQIQLAEDYLDGKLNDEALKSFENELKNNQYLQEYITINKQMRLNYSEEEWAFVADEKNKEIDELEDYLKSGEVKEIKSAIGNASKNFHENKKSSISIKRLYPYLAVVASIVLLVGYFLFNASPTNLELYVENSDWSDLPSLTSRSNADNVLLTNGEKAFLKKDYNKSKETFSRFIKNTSEINPTALIYLGISQLETEDYKSALQTFDSLIESNTLDQSKGYWYKALVYLKMDNRDDAIKQLEIIITSPKNYNYNKAKELLEELK